MSVGVIAHSSVAARAHAIDWRGWTTVGVAALMMVATLPGRTHGLGVVTDPMVMLKTRFPRSCASSAITVPRAASFE